MPAFCPLCARDDHTTQEETPDGETIARCFDPSHGPEGFIWDPTPTTSENSRTNEIGRELDIWDKLLDSIPDDGNVHPYGDIEDRFIGLYPTAATTLQERYGHRWRDGKKSESQYSMSVYLSLRLRELEKEGLLNLTWGPATGEWAYNGVISHWQKT